MSVQTATATATAHDTSRVRLHITPFNAELLDRFVPPSIQSQASHISYHTLQTFPERGFGYVELPVMEATKLKKKLNGTTLKGTKVKIEDAKPEKRTSEKKRKSVEMEDAEPSADAAEKAARKSRKKAKRAEGVLVGHELSEGRHVQRGWEDKNAARKSGSKTSKSTDRGLKDKKNLFKTVLPANVVPLKVKGDKGKKGDKNSKDAKGSSKATVVKEFKNTSKVLNTGSVPTTKRAAVYEDGKGWIDEEGNVVEAEPAARKRDRESRNSALTKSSDSGAKGNPRKTTEAQADGELESDARSAEEDSDAEMSETSTLSSSEEETSSESDAIDDTSEVGKEKEADAVEDAAPDKAFSLGSPAPDQGPGGTLEIEKEIHPLEALYKRRAPEASITSKKAEMLAPIDTSFSFFGGAADEDDAEMETEGVAQVPHTPHTKRDLETRIIRSAAPTPDTAAIGKRFTFPTDRDEADDSEVDDDPIPLDLGSSGTLQPEAEGEKNESEFRKWFYENRGDLNRSWKKRRREEKKLQRQRESRRLGRKLA